MSATQTSKTVSLSAQHVQELESRLQSRHGALRAEIREELLAAEDDYHAQLARDVGERPEGVDRRVAARFRELGLSAIDRHVEELAEVEEALARIEDGHYGQCTDCANPISPQRLEVQPSARRCIDCQTRREAANTAR